MYTGVLTVVVVGRFVGVLKGRVPPGKGKGFSVGRRAVGRFVGLRVGRFVGFRVGRLVGRFDGAFAGGIPGKTGTAVALTLRSRSSLVVVVSLGFLLVFFAVT